MGVSAILESVGFRTLVIIFSLLTGMMPVSGIVQEMQAKKKEPVYKSLVMKVKYGKNSLRKDFSAKSKKFPVIIYSHGFYVENRDKAVKYIPFLF